MENVIEIKSNLSLYHNKLLKIIEDIPFSTTMKQEAMVKTLAEISTGIKVDYKYFSTLAKNHDNSVVASELLYEINIHLEIISNNLYIAITSLRDFEYDHPNVDTAIDNLEKVYHNLAFINDVYDKFILLEEKEDKSFFTNIRNKLKEFDEAILSYIKALYAKIEIPKIDQKQLINSLKIIILNINKEEKDVLRNLKNEGIISIKINKLKKIFIRSSKLYNKSLKAAIKHVKRNHISIAVQDLQYAHKKIMPQLKHYCNDFMIEEYRLLEKARK